MSKPKQIQKTSEQFHRETEFGQVYRVDERGEPYQVVYVDEQVVLLRSTEFRRDGQNIHRIETRSAFDAQRESGWFSLATDVDIDLISEDADVDWTAVPLVGAKTAQHLVENGYRQKVDVLTATEDELTDVDGVGEAAADNLDQFVR